LFGLNKLEEDLKKFGSAMVEFDSSLENICQGGDLKNFGLY
jgi:hypothetical protein